MNRMIKVGFAALALAAVTPSFAQEVEVEEDEGVVGYTAVALGLATPVQLPWGLNRWDVFGIDLNLFYSDAPKMYGLDIGGLATTTRDTAIGMIVGGLANLSYNANVYGLRATLGLNYAEEHVYGADLGMVGVREHIHGLDVEFLGSYQQRMGGLQVSGLANIAREETYGMNVAGLCNWTPVARGFQLAGIFNYTKELHGCQLALVNYTELCPSGFQVGLVNIIMQNSWKVLPIVNGYF